MPLFNFAMNIRIMRTFGSFFVCMLTYLQNVEDKKSKIKFVEKWCELYDRFRELC